jgi:Uma2 family endonuclease
MPITFDTYARVALEDGDALWELACGQLRQKPVMTVEHDGSYWNLAMLLSQQLDAQRYRVSQNGGRLRIASGTYYLPDLCVIPVAVLRRLRRERPGELAVLDEPLPLVVEVWSPSTGDYDVEVKLSEYQLRGDHEIWRLHPYDRTLTTWRRQPDGSYTATRYWGAAIVAPVALHGVQITLAALFE